MAEYVSELEGGSDTAHPVMTRDFLTFGSQSAFV